MFATARNGSPKTSMPALTMRSMVFLLSSTTSNTNERQVKVDVVKVVFHQLGAVWVCCISCPWPSIHNMGCKDLKWSNLSIWNTSMHNLKIFRAKAQAISMAHTGERWNGRSMKIFTNGKMLSHPFAPLWRNYCYSCAAESIFQWLDNTFYEVFQTSKAGGCMQIAVRADAI